MRSNKAFFHIGVDSETFLFEYYPSWNNCCFHECFLKVNIDVCTVQCAARSRRQILPQYSVKFVNWVFQNVKTIFLMYSCLVSNKKSFGNKIWNMSSDNSIQIFMIEKIPLVSLFLVNQNFVVFSLLFFICISFFIRNIGISQVHENAFQKN